MLRIPIWAVLETMDLQVAHCRVQYNGPSIRSESVSRKDLRGHCSQIQYIFIELM